MNKERHIAILGVGLMGASLALALKQRGFKGSISMYARREETRRHALENGLADAVFSDPVEAVRKADLVVVCVPIWSIAALAEQVVPALKPGAVMTDVGSTKSQLIAALKPYFKDQTAYFVGSHPIAGSEKTGILAGDANLYEGRLTVVCPSADTPVEAQQAVTDLWRLAGSEVIAMSPEEHDALLASTSHLPHMVAAALARTVTEGDAEHKANFCGTGFRDTTRVASGSADMWVDIIDTNREALETELERFRIELQNLITILQSGESADIRRWLEEAAADRDRMLRMNRFLKK